MVFQMQNFNKNRKKISKKIIILYEPMPVFTIVNRDSIEKSSTHDKRGYFQCKDSAPEVELYLLAILIITLCNRRDLLLGNAHTPWVYRLYNNANVVRKLANFHYLHWDSIPIKNQRRYLPIGYIFDLFALHFKKFK